MASGRGRYPTGIAFRQMKIPVVRKHTGETPNVFRLELDGVECGFEILVDMLDLRQSDQAVQEFIRLV
jgi:hypothetical protein